MAINPKDFKNSDKGSRIINNKNADLLHKSHEGRRSRIHSRIINMWP